MNTVNSESNKRELDDSGCVQDDSPPRKRKLEEERRQRTGLLDLSDDVLLLIMKYCSPMDLKALGYTCPRLGSVIRDRSLWQCVDITSVPTGEARLKWFVTYCLNASTTALQLSGFSRETPGCFGYVNRSRKEAEEESCRHDFDKNNQDTKDSNTNDNPSSNSTNGSESLSAPGSNSTNGSESLSAPGNNSTNGSESLSVPGNNSTNGSESLSAPGNAEDGVPSQSNNQRHSNSELESNIRCEIFNSIEDYQVFTRNCSSRGGSSYIAGVRGIVAGFYGNVAGRSENVAGGSGNVAGRSGNIAGGSGNVAGGSGNVAGGSGNGKNNGAHSSNSTSDDPKSQTNGSLKIKINQNSNFQQNISIVENMKKDEKDSSNEGQAKLEDNRNVENDTCIDLNKQELEYKTEKNLTNILSEDGIINMNTVYNSLSSQSVASSSSTKKDDANDKDEIVASNSTVSLDMNDTSNLNTNKKGEYVADNSIARPIKGDESVASNSIVNNRDESVASNNCSDANVINNNRRGHNDERNANNRGHPISLNDLNNLPWNINTIPCAQREAGFRNETNNNIENNIERLRQNYFPISSQYHCYTGFNICAPQMLRSVRFPSMSDLQDDTQCDEPLLMNVDSECPGPRFTVTRALLDQLRNKCPNLTVLNLEYCNFDYRTTIMSHFPATLKKMSLRGSKCYNQPFDKSFLFRIHDYIPDLEEMDLSECSWFEPSSLLSISKLKALRVLRMRDCYKLSEFVAYASLASRYGFKQVEILDIRGSPLGDSEVSALGWLPELRELYCAPATNRDLPRPHAHYRDDVMREFNELEHWEMQEPEYYNNKQDLNDTAQKNVEAKQKENSTTEKLNQDPGSPMIVTAGSTPHGTAESHVISPDGPQEKPSANQGFQDNSQLDQPPPTKRMKPNNEEAENKNADSSSGVTIKMVDFRVNEGASTSSNSKINTQDQNDADVSDLNNQQNNPNLHRNAQHNRDIYVRFVMNQTGPENQLNEPNGQNLQQNNTNDQQNIPNPQQNNSNDQQNYENQQRDNLYEYNQNLQRINLNNQQNNPNPQQNVQNGNDICFRVVINREHQGEHAIANANRENHQDLQQPNNLNDQQNNATDQQNNANNQQNNPNENRREPRHRILCVNIGNRRLPSLAHSTFRQGSLCFFPNPRSHVDYSSLVSDSSIKRFGRADGDSVNYIFIGVYARTGERPCKSNLRVLSVNGYRHITDRSLEHLATAAPYLRHLDLTETSVTPRGVKKFKSLRPDCEVIFSPFTQSED